MSIKIALPLPPELQPQTTAEQNQLMDDMIGWGRSHADEAHQQARSQTRAECFACQFWAVTNTVVRRESGEATPESGNDFEQMVVEKFRRQWVAVYFVETASYRQHAAAQDEGEAVRRGGKLD